MSYPANFSRGSKVRINSEGALPLVLVVGQAMTCSSTSPANVMYARYTLACMLIELITMCYVHITTLYDCLIPVIETVQPTCIHAILQHARLILNGGFGWATSTGVSVPKTRFRPGTAAQSRTPFCSTARAPSPSQSTNGANFGSKRR